MIENTLAVLWVACVIYGGIVLSAGANANIQKTRTGRDGITRRIHDRLYHRILFPLSWIVAVTALVAWIVIVRTG